MKRSSDQGKRSSGAGVLSLAQLLEHNPTPTPSLIEPGLLPANGILFVGGEPKVGKSLLVANLALGLWLRALHAPASKSLPPGACLSVSSNYQRLSLPHGSRPCANPSARPPTPTCSSTPRRPAICLAHRAD
jgi:hypothetical protein